MRAMRPHQLSDELERFLHDQSVVGASAWNKLFDETMAGLMFTVEGEEEELNLEATLNLLTDPDRARREAARGRWREVFDRNIKLFRPGPQHAGQGKGNRRPLAQDAHAPAPPATCRTMSNPRWSRRCAMPWWRPIRSCRTAITG
jgi:hypothetical protein